MKVASKKSIFKEKKGKRLSSKLPTFYPKDSCLNHAFAYHLWPLSGCSEFQILYLVMGYFSHAQKWREPSKAVKVLTKKKKTEWCLRRHTSLSPIQIPTNKLFPSKLYFPPEYALPSDDYHKYYHLMTYIYILCKTCFLFMFSYHSVWHLRSKTIFVLLAQE